MSGGSETVVHAVAFFLISVFAGILVRTVNNAIPRQYQAPETVIVFLLGIVLGYAASQGGEWGDSISIASSSPDVANLILLVLLPPLIYESASTTDVFVFRKILGQALLLAGPGVIINMVFIALVAKFLTPFGWGWDIAFILGSVLAATDPVAVVASLHSLGAPPQLSVVIEGESLLNDGTAFVMFLIFQDFANPASPNKSVGELIEFFCRLSVAGPCWGLLCGLGLYIWLLVSNFDRQMEVSAVVVTFYMCFFLAEHSLKVSGILATVVLGLFMAWRGNYALSAEVEHDMHTLLSGLSYWANTIIFFISGVLTYEKILNQSEVVDDGALWGSLILVYVMMHLIRGFMVCMFWPLIRKMGYGLTKQEGVLMVFAGLRGAIGLALGQILTETDLADNDEPLTQLLRVRFLIAGVVFMTLVINGTTSERLYHYLNLHPPSPDRFVVLKKAVHNLEHHTIKHERDELKHDPLYWAVDWDMVIEIVPQLDSYEKVGNNISLPALVSINTLFTCLRQHDHSHWKLEQVDAETEAKIIKDDVEMKEMSANRKPSASERGEHGSVINTSDPPLEFPKIAENMVQPSLSRSEPPRTSSDSLTKDNEDSEIHKLEISVEKPKSIDSSPAAEHSSDASSPWKLSRRKSTSVCSMIESVRSTRDNLQLRRTETKAGVSLDDVNDVVVTLTLSSLKNSFLHQHEHHHLSEEALVPLVEAVNYGQLLHTQTPDGNNCSQADLRSPMKAITKHLLKHLPYPLSEFWLDKLKSPFKFVSRFAEAEVFVAIVVTIESLGGYIRAITDVRTELHQAHFFSDIDAILVEEINRVEKLLNRCRKEFDRPTQVVETVLAARVLINVKLNRVDELYAEGFITGSDRNVFNAQLRKRQNQLKNFYLNPWVARL